MKKKKYKKGMLVLAKSQDYGNCIALLVYRVERNVKGNFISPFWESYILDTDEERNLIEFILDNGHRVGFFENLDKHNFIIEVLQEVRNSSQD